MTEIEYDLHVEIFIFLVTNNKYKDLVYNCYYIYQSLAAEKQCYGSCWHSIFIADFLFK